MTVDPAGSGAPISDRMASLLSRAVEDQLVEQRQVAGALNELRGQLQAIGADVARLRDAAANGGAAGSVDAAVASVAADVREAVRLLAERLDGVARLVQQRGADLAELNAGTTALQGAVRTHGEALAGLSKGLGVVPALGDHIDALQQRVDSVDTGLRELRSAFAAIGARMAELPGRADLEAAASRSVAAVEATGERLGRLEQTVAGVASTLAQPRPAASPDPALAGLADLPARLDRLAGDQAQTAAGTGERLSALERGLADVLAAVSVDEDDDGADEPADDLDAKVAAAVEQAVAASEQRLSAHFDEAVLALAEALLRRRTTRTGSVAPSVTDAGGPARVAPGGETGTDPDGNGHDDEAGAGDDAADQAGIDDEGAGGDQAGGRAPWQTPPAGHVGTAPGQAAPAGEDRRRRPWWRPGE